MQHVLVQVQVLDEGGDSAFVLKAVVAAVALVLECDDDAAVQEAQLSKPL